MKTRRAGNFVGSRQRPRRNVLHRRRRLICESLEDRRLLAAVFINEFHYDNTGGDSGETIEIAGPAGTNLSGWSVALYNGSGGGLYNTIALSGTLPNQQAGFGTLSFAQAGIQNGAPDGLALVDAGSTVIEFLSYEGSFVAVGGPADGMSSTDIGVSESSGSPVGNSLQLTGVGTISGDFTWAGSQPNTFGAVNTTQTFGSLPAAFINEIHYDNAGADTGEAVEIAGPAGTDLSGWSVALYNGSGGGLYNTIALSGTIPDQQSGYGTLSFAQAGIQNGAPDGLALVYAGSTVVEFLSYEGSFVAVGGPADGMASTDIGVSESSGSTVGDSLQLIGVGTISGDFSWATSQPNTFGAVNTTQTFGSLPAVFLNEIHYDNTGADTGEAVEIAGPAGTDLSGWSVALYNGSGGGLYNTIALSGTIPDQQSGYGTLSFAQAGIQNGAPDGLALVYAGSTVVEFLSYEGSFVAVGGPADGMASTDIGVSESSGSTVGDSLQLIGVGTMSGDFTWAGSQPNTFGAVNTTQTFGSPPTIDSITVSKQSINESDPPVVVSGTFSDPDKGANTGTAETFTGTALWSDGIVTTLVIDSANCTFSTSRSFPDDDPMTGTPSDDFTVEITIIDDALLSDSATSPVITVNNVAPVLTSVINPSPLDDKGAEGEPVTLELDFTDPGSLDVHTVEVDWGDGNAETIVLTVGDRSFAEDHTYAMGGIYEIIVTVSDDDTGEASESLTAIVSGVSVQEFKGETVLQIIGTSEVDHISVNQTGNGLIKVHWDFLGDDPREIPAAGVDRILAILCEGDDHLNISGRITLPTIIDAGAGNDHVNGGGGSDIILGGPDDDHLNGGNGRDILIGGDGIDRIVGGPGQDIVTGDRIQHASAPNEELLENCDALLAAQDRWLDDDPIEDRVDDLDDFLASMFDDLNSDKLTGSSSEDHVVLFSGDTWTDEKSNGKGKKR